MTSHTDVVARAAGQELKVDEAARMLAANPQVPADPQVVGALAEIWTDYTLLATAAAEDTTLSALDMDRFILPEREQALIFRLRDQVVRPDTVFTDAQIQQRWTTEGPGTEIRARHILLRIPAEATPAQRDSIRQLAESLRQRAGGGEDFAALATRFSQDPGSAARGGDLGEFFGRGRMVAPFEEAAFQLQPGQISPVVESPFGLHVIRVEDRRQQELGPQREQFRQYLTQRSVQDAEATFLDSLSTAAGVEVQPGAARLAREMVQQPGARLRGRAAERRLAAYREGALTTGEFAEYLQTIPAQALAGFDQATDEDIEGLIRQLTEKEVLLDEARRRGIRITPAETDSIRVQARRAFQEVLQMTGLNRRTPRGAAGAAARQARVRELIEGVVTGQRQVPPLNRLGAALRSSYGAETYETSYPAVVQKLTELRASQPAPTPPAGTGQMPAPQPVPGQVPPPVPDTSQR
ncbi:MAG: peptidylprolyl isomerase [Gemmatimonadota bacterium]|nr:peptidylprolyl isomerase [Gemmatimonadota bacterium]